MENIWYYQIQLQSLRAEIEYFNRQIHIMPFLFMILMGVILVISKKPEFRNWVVFSVILGATLPFVIARADFLMHRAAAYQRVVEERIINPQGPLPGWETAKDSHHGTRFVPAFDLLAIIPFLILFGYCWLLAYDFTSERSYLIFPKIAVWGALILFPLGCFTIWLATVLARK